MTPDMRDAHETARARDARASTVTYEVHMCTEGNADFDHVINCPALHTLRTRTHAINPDTGEFTRLDQESDMATSTITRTITVRLDPELRDLLTEIRDRLPVVIEPADLAPFVGLTEPSVNVTETPDLSTEDAGESSEPAPGMTRCDTCGTERPLDAICPGCDPAPADDLPGEPVEPGDLRAGDRVAYTYRWKRYEGALVVTTMRRQPITTLEHAGLLVTFEGRWAGGISDVRLIEPAPADVDPDEALAMDLYHESLLIPPVKEIGPTAWLSERDHEMWLGVARVAREHIEAERSEAEAKRDQWKADVRDAAIARAERAEADLARVTEERDTLRDRVDELLRERQGFIRERDEARARHAALRADVDEFQYRHREHPSTWELVDALGRDTGRAES